MKMIYLGESFGRGYAGLTNGKEYECIGVQCGLLQVIDDSGEDYLYSPVAPGPANDSTIRGAWEIIEDKEGFREEARRQAKNLKPFP